MAKDLLNEAAHLKMHILQFDTHYIAVSVVVVTFGRRIYHFQIYMHERSMPVQEIKLISLISDL